MVIELVETQRRYASPHPQPFSRKGRRGKPASGCIYRQAVRRVGRVQRNPPFVTANWRNDGLVAIKAAPARSSALFGIAKGSGIGRFGTHAEHSRVADGIEHLGQRLFGGLAIPFTEGEGSNRGSACCF